MVKSKLLSSIPVEKRIEAILKCWMSHDARWQFFTFQELGIEKGNELNQRVSHEIGKIMMHRALNALEITHVTTIEELQAILEAVMELYYPSSNFLYHFEQKSDATLRAIMEYCSIYENVKKAGIADQYECGCVAVHSGWFEAMGIEGEREMQECLKNSDKHCEFLFRVTNWS